MLDGIGLPSSSRFSENGESSDMFREPPTGLADGLGLGLSFGGNADTPQLPLVPPYPTRVAQEFWPKRMLSYRASLARHALPRQRPGSRRRLPVLRPVDRATRVVDGLGAQSRGRPRRGGGGRRARR